MRPARSMAWLGVALMLAGALGPWAVAQTWNSGTVGVSGSGHGGALICACCVFAGAAMALGAVRTASLIGVLAVAWLTLALYELPGSLIANEAWEAHIAWGGYAALIGALLVATCSARDGRRVSGGAGVERRNSPLRRG